MNNNTCIVYVTGNVEYQTTYTFPSNVNHEYKQIIYNIDRS